ncbi:autoinducer binding domain-containing protein [Roseateles flavus]|uniref:Autoinducer binding domain-containing protein n=1 Tax=Roseateles flavus TaxID=3149041 RepID=A0ABV0GGB2_9BURK
MQKWAQDLLMALERARGTQGVYDAIQAASARLGFEWCAFGVRFHRFPSQIPVSLLNNYPSSWRLRYDQADYLSIDPTIARADRSQLPFLWSDTLFSSAVGLWQEAQDMGLRVGWAQSRFDAQGIGSLLTLARSAEPLSDAELRGKALALNWLVSVAHESLTKALAPASFWEPKASLTQREIEVLKWAAAGKTTEDTATILAISVDTAKFHIKNAIAKLGAPNKIAAVVRAMALGLLN